MKDRQILGAVHAVSQSFSCGADFSEKSAIEISWDGGSLRIAFYGDQHISGILPGDMIKVSELPGFRQGAKSAMKRKDAK
jgi:hypothetical protein